MPGKHQVAALYFHGGWTDGKTSENTAVDSWGPQNWWGGRMLCSVPPQPPAVLTLNQGFTKTIYPI